MRIGRTDLPLLGALLAIIAQPAVACSIAPPLPPPPQATDEADAEFAERVAQFRRDQRNEERAQWLASRIEYENQLWATSERVFIATIVKTNRGRTRSHGGLGIAVSLKPAQWFKGEGANSRFKLKPVSYNSCNYPGNGTAIHGEVGELFLVFADAGQIGVHTVKHTMRLNEAASERSQEAIGRRN